MKYVCTICNYVYDDDEQNVPFAELPESWSCPICGAPKSAFEPMNTAAEDKAETAVSSTAEAESDEDMTKLSAGELAALCSSLARGCEAQYKPEESKLYKKLADYFLSRVPAVEAEGTKELSQLLEKDTLSYAALHAAAADKSDRGALRACVWSEKVTRILSSLINRYEKEGEAAFEGKDIWVCSVCGFVFVGEEPPAVCPVCKVPAWKFVKIGKGRAEI